MLTRPCTQHLRGITAIHKHYTVEQWKNWAEGRRLKTWTRDQRQYGSNFLYYSWYLIVGREIITCDFKTLLNPIHKLWWLQCMLCMFVNTTMHCSWWSSAPHSLASIWKYHPGDHVVGCHWKKLEGMKKYQKMTWNVRAYYQRFELRKRTNCFFFGNDMAEPEQYDDMMTSLLTEPKVMSDARNLLKHSLVIQISPNKVA